MMIERKKIYVALIHILIWMLYISPSLSGYNESVDGPLGMLIFKKYTFHAIDAFVFYLNYFILLPKFFFYKRYVKYILCLLLTWVAAYCLFVLHGYLLYIITNEINYYSIRIVDFYFPIIIQFGIFTAISFGARLLSDWFKTQAISEELAKAELALLRHQISPHFLFNTLNNIYLLVKRKSDAAPEAVLKLSELLRYNLIDNIDEKVAVSSEIEFIDSFIELQKLRMPYPQVISYKKEVDNGESKIYPLLLIPFIENVFKHGLINSPDAIAKIEITSSSNNVILITENRYKEQFKDNTTGIGINNVVKRLKLLYKDNHDLEIKNDGINYICRLSINLGN